MPLCQAVQHAHQKGIIHRDLKPSNVLVTVHDGTPLVKVIDFGIAKALGQQLTDKTLFTGFAQMIGTPLYMSPEQAALSNVDVDTRSDIYSLGVLLYELLTGTTPFDKERLQTVGYDEIRRIIREEEPVRPSTRISTLGPAAATMSARRQSDPKKLGRLLRGELDWIVMKALEKDRNRRYETASAFAADVRRYLADEPVQACPPSVGYRLRKLAWRNRGRLAAAGVLGLALLVAVGGLGWAAQDRAARQARTANDLELALDRAELFQGEGKRAEALAAFDRAELLAGQAPPEQARKERLAALKERLAAEARDQEFLARFEEIRLRVQSQVNVAVSLFNQKAAFPEVREALRRYGIEIGVTAPAQATARVQGRPEPVRRDLIAALDECLWYAPPGDAQSRQWLLTALADADKDPWRIRVRKALAGSDWQTLEPLVRAADVQKQPPSFLLGVAEELPERMRPTRLELLQRTQRAYPADLWANHGLARELCKNGQLAEAIRYYTAALALRPDSPGIYLNRGLALQDVGEVDAAIADYRQALVLAPQYAVAHTNLSDALRLKGCLDAAIAECREAIRIKEDAPPHLSLGNALLAKGQLEDAIAEYRRAIRINKDWPDGHYNLGNALLAKGQLEDAIAEYREASRLKKDWPQAHTNLGNALRLKGCLDAAIAECREAIRLKNDLLEAHNGLGLALQLKGQLDEAIAAYREAIRLKKDYPEAHCNLSNALRHKGQLDASSAEAREAVRLKKDFAVAHYTLGLVLEAKGDLDGGIAAYREAIRLNKDYAQAHCNLGHGLRQQGAFREALDELRRGHELGSRNPRWRYPSAQWVRECERLVDLDGRLPGLLAGKTTPASADERIAVAELCSLKSLKRAAVRFYEEAFAAEPKLAEQLDSHRYDAACAAALAACGTGKDADKLEDQERDRLRRRTLDWLRADLAAWGRLLDREPDQASSAVKVSKAMQHWLADPDLRGVRSAEVLAALPQAERQSWRQFWDDVAGLLARAQAKPATEKKAPAR